MTFDVDVALQYQILCVDVLIAWRIVRIGTLYFCKDTQAVHGVARPIPNLPLRAMDIASVGNGLNEGHVPGMIGGFSSR